MTAIHKHGQRIQTPDIIKGITLFGILVVNMQAYTLFAFLRPGQVYALELDKPGTYAPLQFLIQVFFRGQFYTIYCFLFGLCFYLMLQKSKNAGRNGNHIFKCRLWSLLLIGLIHGFIFWFGDILHRYALLGFTLPYFNKKSVPAIIKWIIAIALFVILFQVIRTVFFPMSAGADERERDEVIMELADAWQNGSLLRVMQMQTVATVLVWKMSLQSGFASLAHCEIMFLLGLIAGKAGFLAHIGKGKTKFAGVALAIFPFALGLKIISCIDILQLHLLPAGLRDYERLLFSVSGFAGTPLLTIGCLAVLAMLFRGKPLPVFVWIGIAGRMGLTNYLGQTLLCMLLFYGYAQGMSGHMTLCESFIPAILIYVFQVLYSNIWFNEFGTGPIEKLWRKMAGGKNLLSPKQTIKVTDRPDVNNQTISIVNLNNKPSGFK